MSIIEVPKAYQYECDLCGEKHIQQNARGHYWESTPEGWITFRIAFNQVDLKGDGYKKYGVTEFLACPKHYSALGKFLEEGTRQ